MINRIDTSPEAVEIYIHRAMGHRQASVEKGFYKSSGFALSSIEMTRALSARIAELEAELQSITLDCLAAHGQAGDAHKAQERIEYTSDQWRRDVSKTISEGLLTDQRGAAQ